MHMCVCHILIYVYFPVNCGSLNVIGSRKFIENGIIRRCGLSELGTAFLEKVCHFGVSFEFSFAHASHSVSFRSYSLVDRRCRTLRYISNTLSVCPLTCSLSHNGLNL